MGLFGFAAIELVYAGRNQPENLAIAALVYSAVTFIGMALYGVERWSRRGEAFSVYFNFFSRISVFETRDGEVGLRKPLSGLPRLNPVPGTVALLMVMIGTVSFDGFTNKRTWNAHSADIAQFFQDHLSLSPEQSLELTFLLGMTATVLFISGFYWLGILGAKSVGGGFSARELAGRFVHSLVPIAAAYVGAHYFTLLLYQGQSLAYLASDPLGHGSDIFGTAGTQVPLRPDRLERGVVREGRDDRLRPRGRPDPGPRPGRRALPRRAPGGALSVLDARRDARVHPARHLASVGVEHVMLPIAHAGHWLTGIAYFLPVIAFLVWLGITQVRERRRKS